MGCSIKTSKRDKSYNKKQNKMQRQSEEKPTACFCYGSLRPDDDSGMPWTKKAAAFMCSRKAIVKDVELFRATYATAILNRPGK